MTAEQDIDKDAVYTEDGKGDTEVTEDEESDSDNEEVALRKQAEASVDVPYPPLQIVNSIPFRLFSLYLYPLSAPFLNFLSTIPFFLF